MDIEGLGEAAVGQLVARELATDLADIYFLKKEDLLSLELFKEKKSENLIAAIEKSKRQPLSRFLFGLGIRHVGEKAALTLAERFGSIDRVAAASVDDLTAIHEIGDVMAHSITSYFRSASITRLVAKFKKAGLMMLEPRRTTGAQPLRGKVFVFTGELLSFSRQEAQRLVRELGGSSSSSVSAHTDYVVAGPEAGSKLTKAKKLGVTVIDEQEFRGMLG